MNDQRLGHYWILERIGTGGMGEVYLALDERLNREVAIKVLPQRALTDKSFQKRLRKEAQALSKLNHPNIEVLFELNTLDNADFLVVEYVAGVTLSDMLAKGALLEKDIARLGGQLADGLAAAHAQRVVHCDLKPGNLRITAQLIQGATDKHLWAESYERDLRDVLKLQAEVASAIADEIKIAVTPQEQERLTSTPPVIPAAYEAYLKGRYHWNTGAEQDLQKARQYFEQAAQIDPNYASAYAGLADFYWVTDKLPPAVKMPKAKQYALKALELDSNLAEEHTSLGAVRFYADWNWRDAERDFRRALQLDPGNVEAHRLLSVYLSEMGRADEALVQIRKALELDPLSIGEL